MMRALALVLVAGCAAPRPSKTTLTSTPACAADACVYGEPFSTADECAARGLTVSDAELTDYLVAGGPLGEFGAPGGFTPERYSTIVRYRCILFAALRA